MRKNQIHSLNWLSGKRSELRSNLTMAEAALWANLKGHALAGRKFRRQHSIGNYIVDFYCASEKLIVELDGNYHFDPMISEDDQIRDEQLRSLGFRVLRFENMLVFNDLPGVLREIESMFRKTNQVE
jgi:very-short-patch-repair endonuclease